MIWYGTALEGQELGILTSMVRPPLTLCTSPYYAQAKKGWCTLVLSLKLGVSSEAGCCSALISVCQDGFVTFRAKKTEPRCFNIPVLLTCSWKKIELRLLNSRFFSVLRFVFYAKLRYTAVLPEQGCSNEAVSLNKAVKIACHE